MFKIVKKPICYKETRLKTRVTKYSKVSFGSRNRPLEWNDYSIGIVILLFSRGLFLGIVILISLELFDSIPLNLHLLDLVCVVYITFCCSFVLCLTFKS
jgi:hypothetical protein